LYDINTEYLNLQKITASLNIELVPISRNDMCLLFLHFTNKIVAINANVHSTVWLTVSRQCLSQITWL